jgi:hypothetical protein
MEYKRIWLPYCNSLNQDLFYVSPTDDENTKAADEEIAEHLKNGWRIVSAVPITESSSFSKLGLRDYSDSVFTYTSGIEVFIVKE